MAEIEHGAVTQELSRVLVYRLARRVGDRVAVALEKPDHGHVAGEELAGAGHAVVGPFEGDLDSLPDVRDGYPVGPARIEAVASPGVVGLVGGGRELGQERLGR